MIKKNHNALFSIELQNKIDLLKSRRKNLQLGRVHFSSPLILAPMSGIGIAPFRLLMEDLGAGGTVSELISCHGINYKNIRTKEMLKLHPLEKNVGLQLFGEKAEALALSAKVVEEFGPKFIDINMGCPVKKVVGTGAGSSLLKDTSILGHFFKTIKQAITVPLTIKIRTGWDKESINANEVIHIAHEEGIEFVAIHGRTRSQQYAGFADWNLLEELAQQSPLPIIGNGDLHTKKLVQQKLSTTKCQGLMLGRGPLKNPFIFLEPYINLDEEINFTPQDYFEVILKLSEYLADHSQNQRHVLVSLRKHIVWIAGGLVGVGHFRDLIYKTTSLSETIKITEDFFHQTHKNKLSDENEDQMTSFMAGGHG